MFRTEVVDKVKTHSLYSTIFFGIHAVYEITWKNFIVVEPEMPQMKI